jgi:hypothetical protein
MRDVSRASLKLGASRATDGPDHDALIAAVRDASERFYRTRYALERELVLAPLTALCANVLRP